MLLVMLLSKHNGMMSELLHMMLTVVLVQQPIQMFMQTEQQKLFQATTLLLQAERCSLSGIH